ncbi:cation diffusion facilitator family transporter [Leptospira ryugenii]|uniref:Cation diffusion facilitator family transporter n=1 Tax=Leptospira ryugenii TaxID=1917863 RepID=A0A2P2DVH3_9LEPT|nr:cation diffusion facilitator family transporter [Leptospira ryugenii]GBF48642.1 cation diffusion facilitator family transporter [Leptospira ryugenii]
MSHEHSHDQDTAGKNIAIGFVLNLLFAGIELIGGLYTNSVAILSDALHDFGDALSLAVSWYLQKVSKKPRDIKYSYGYKRFSLLGSLVISIVLTIGSIIMITESVKRLIEPQSTNAQGMFYLAILGITINGIAAMRMKRGNSLNERAVFLHFMEDVLGWVAVLIGSILMLFFPVVWFDPLISIGIAIWVLINVFKNLNKVSRIFLQETPENLDINKLQAELEKVTTLSSLHDLHIWSLDGQHHIMTLHAVVAKESTPAERIKIKKSLRAVAQSYNIEHTTIEIEIENEVCDVGGGDYE